MIFYVLGNPCRYPSGDRLSPVHEKMILERLLPYHPEFESKIGCGVDFITVSFYSSSSMNFISNAKIYISFELCDALYFRANYFLLDIPY